MDKSPRYQNGLRKLMSKLVSIIETASTFILYALLEIPVIVIRILLKILVYLYTILLALQVSILNTVLKENVPDLYKKIQNEKDKL